MNNFTLKIIAIVTMLIDHTAAVLLTQTEYYLLLRTIGRFAFPIFIFLITEGFNKTRDLKKMLVRLGIFALISEIPFDLAFYHGKIDWKYFDLVFLKRPELWQHQNIFFTLLFGGLGYLIYTKLKEKQGVGALMFPVILAILAEWWRFDYGMFGVLMVFFASIVYPSIKGRAGVIAIGNLLFFGAGSRLQIYALLSIIPILLYNGKRGFNMKYVFYVFYPVHLGILALINNL